LFEPVHCHAVRGVNGPFGGWKLQAPFARAHFPSMQASPAAHVPPGPQASAAEHWPGAIHASPVPQHALPQAVPEQAEATHWPPCWDCPGGQPPLLLVSAAEPLPLLQLSTAVRTKAASTQ
jgi:hypothetical protein